MVIRTFLLFLYLFLFLFLFLFLSTAHASNECPRAYCDINGPIIQFPFWLQGAVTPPNCAPSGFNLSCNGQIYPILHIPNSGNFYVKSVYYYIRRITLQDVEDCLLQRLLSLNLLSTPFMAVDYRNYTFLSCPKGEVFSASLDLVKCDALNETFDVFAVDDVSYHSSRFSDCSEIASIPVPVSSYLLFPVDLELTWAARNPETGKNKRTDLIFPLVFTMPIVFLILVVIAWVCMKNRGSHNSTNSIQVSHSEASSLATSGGLDISTIETYKKITIEEGLVEGPHGVTCTICLADYATNDTIRFMPKCEHYFHVECIDEWLSMSAKCPICRISLPNSS